MTNQLHSEARRSQEWDREGTVTEDQWGQSTRASDSTWNECSIVSEVARETLPEKHWCGVTVLRKKKVFGEISKDSKGWNSLRGCGVKRMKAVSGESCHDFYKKFHHAEKDVRGTTHRGHMSPGRFFLLWLFCFSSVQRCKHLFSPRERSQDRRVRWRLNSKYCIWLIMVLKQNRWDQGQHRRCWHWTRDRAFILWPWRQRGREGTEEHEFLWGEEGQEVEVVHTWWRKVRSYIQRQAVGQRKTGTRMGANPDQIQRLMNKVESGPAEAEGH